MQIIGFNFTKLSAEKPKDFKPKSPTTNIEFTDLIKEKVDLLKDLEAIKIFFKYAIAYISENEKNPQGEISINGEIIVALQKEDAKELEKFWKKKEIQSKVKLPLFNLILKKCTPKAVFLAEEVSLPIPVPLPRLAPKKQN